MNEKKEPKKPEFFFVGDQEETQDVEYSEFVEKERIFQQFKKLDEASYPFFLRILTLIGSAILFIVSLIPLAMTAVYLVFCLVSFFQVKALTGLLKRVWSNFQKLLVMGIGFLIATFIPPLGFGLILLYVMLQGDKLKGDRMAAFVMSRLMKEDQ